MRDYLTSFSGEPKLKLSAEDAERLTKRAGFTVLSVESHEDGWLVRVDDLGLEDTHRLARQETLRQRLANVDLDMVWWSRDYKFFVVNVPYYWRD